MVHRFQIVYTAATVVILGIGNLYAAAAEPAVPEPAVAESAASEPAEASMPASHEEPLYQVSDSPEEFAARFGWWGTNTIGSPTKVGEYQGLSPSSPFWDVDGLRSNGTKTLSFSANGPEDESTHADLHFYNGPGLTADIQYERFPHRLDHDPFPGFVAPNDAKNPTTPTLGNPYSYTDNNFGHDYAIRVQEIKANFKGNINDSIKWRVNYFGIQKEGDRQATAVTHCARTTAQTGTGFNRQCHVLSQSQRILWQTSEVEPVIEMSLTDSLRLEYSRTMRTFTQADSVVTTTYNLTPAVSAGTTGVYDLVPDSTTEIDRLKAHGQLGEATDVYVLSYVGNTRNQFRDTNRHFGGVDGRITNNSIDGLTLTAFGKTYTENTQAPTTALGQSLYLEPDLNGPLNNTPGIVQPVNRDVADFGVNGRWRPFFDEVGTVRSRFALIGGYDYGTIRRGNATYPNNHGTFTFTQPDTDSNTLFLGVEEKFSKEFSTYLKYKLIDTDYPLYGVTLESHTLANAITTNLPTREDRIELGATWSPTDRFMLNGTGWYENASNHGPYANFESNSFPFSFTTWYSVTSQWSLNGGYAYFPNHITQDVVLGADSNVTATIPFRSPWTYMQEASVVNIGANYAYSERLSFNGGIEYVRGVDVISNIPDNGAISYSDIPGYSKVSVDTCRVSAGVDYLIRRNLTTYVRYNYYNYGDTVTAYNAGTAHMLLGGLTATF